MRQELSLRLLQKRWATTKIFCFLASDFSLVENHVIEIGEARRVARRNGPRAARKSRQKESLEKAA